MCSLWRHFKIWSQREVWNQDLSLIARVFSFSNEKTLGTRLKSRLRFSESFRISNHPSIFIISRLLSSHSPQNLKLQNVFRTLRLYLITSFQHFWTTHAWTQPEVGLFPCLVWNRIQACWKSRAAQVTKNSEGYPFPRDNLKKKSFTWL